VDENGPKTTHGKVLIDAGPGGSPDGSRVVYLHAGCPRCFAAYEVKNLDTGEVRVVGGSPLLPPLIDTPREAAWSADGRLLAFVEQDLDSPRPRLFVLDVQRGERRSVAVVAGKQAVPRDRGRAARRG